MNYETFRLLADVAELTLIPLAYLLWKMERRIFAIELQLRLKHGRREGETA